jgi:hypothetical protein
MEVLMLTLYVGKRKITLRLMTIFLLILFTPLILAFAFLQELPDSFETLGDVLIWIFVGGGGMWLTGRVVAMLLENWAWWHTLPSSYKRIFVVIIAGVFAIAAESVYVSGLLDMIPPYVSMILLTMINWLFGQKQYVEIKEGAYGASARKKKLPTPPPPAG